MRRVGLAAFLGCSAVAAGRYGFILLAGGSRDVRAAQADLPALDRATVLIAAHNEASVIRESLCRVLASTRVDIDVVVADDGSTDETAELCAAVAAIDERVTVLRLPRRGKVPTVHAALASIVAENIVTVDADTLVEPDCVECLLHAMASRGLAACAGNMYGHPEQLPAGRVQALEYLVLNGDRSALARWSAVSILPGALTGWRLVDLRRLIEAVPSTNDIDMTFAALDAGMKVGFAADAVARTTVPTTFAGAARQRRRWARRKINRSPAILRRVLRPYTPGTARLAYVHLLIVHVLLALFGWWIELWVLVVLVMATRGQARSLLAPTIGTYALLTSLSVAVYRRDARVRISAWWLIGASCERLMRGGAALSVLVLPGRNRASWQPARQSASGGAARVRNAVP